MWYLQRKGKNWCMQWHKRISEILLMQGTKDIILYASICFFHQNLLFSFQNCFSKSDTSNPSRFSLGLTSKVFFFLEDINHTGFLRLFSLNLISLNSDMWLNNRWDNSKNKFLKTNNLENILLITNNLEGTIMILNGEGNGNPLQYSCLENPRDRGSLVGCCLWGRTESDMTEAT